VNNRSLTKEATGILVSILFLALGFLAVWLMQSMHVAAGDAVFVSLLLIPIIVYVIFTGRLGEIKTPGGLEAKFVNMAQQPAAEIASERVAVVDEEMKVVTKSGPQELERLESLLNESKRIVLTLLLARRHYDREDAELYLERFLRYRNFTFVAFLDKKDRLVAYISSWAMFRILKGDQGDRFIQLINDGNVLELVDFPGVMTHTVSTNDSNIEALNKLTANNLDAIPVIDEARKLKGVVEREQILGKLMLAMAR
jgi:CBS domain-containing protein